MMKLFALALLFGSSVFFSPAKENTQNNQIRENYVQNALILRSSATDSFLNYWKTEFKPEGVKACDITKENYLIMMEKFNELTSQEQAEVKAENDLESGYTIGDVIKVLVNKYYPNKESVKEDKPKLDQRSIIILASVISIVGMTAISVLYILKNKKIIK